MAYSTLPCNLAGAWMHSACKDGSIRSTAPPPGCRRAGCSGSSLSKNRPCQPEEKVLPDSCNDPRAACISLDNGNIPLYMEIHMETGNLLMETGNLLTRRELNPGQDCHCSMQ